MLATILRTAGSSGVTADPADPARPKWAQNYGINFFHCKFNTAIFCGRALTVLLQRLKSHAFTPLEISLLLQTKETNIAITRCVFWALMPQKCVPVGGRGSAADPGGRAYSAPRTPSRILGGCFVARKGKERGNGLGEGDKQGGKGR